MTRHELQLLEKRIARHHSTSTSFDQLPISHVPLFDSIDHVDTRQQLYTQYQEIIQQSTRDMFNLYTNTAKKQMQHYQQEYRDHLRRMWQEQHSLPREQPIIPVMVDLIEQRTTIIADRLQCIYDFKTKTGSLQSSD